MWIKRSHTLSEGATTWRRAVVVLLLMMSALFASGHAAAQAPADPANPLAISAADATWGRASAPVTLVHFGDLQCPFCVRAATTLNQLKKKYGPNQLRVVYKHMPLSFHKAARPAAEVAVVVYQLRGADAFWKFVAATYRNLGDSGPFGSLSEVGLTEATVRRAIARGNARQRVAADIALAGRVGVRGTPASFVNGVFLSGARPLAQFTEVIDAQLLAAAGLRRDGIAAADVSRRLTQRNFKKPAARPKPSAPAPPAADTTTVWNVPVGRSPQAGPANAPVTLVVFSDFQCPFCRRWVPHIAELEKKYGRKLRVVFKHLPLPFHKRAVPAAQFAIHALVTRGAKGFWRAHDKLFENALTLEDADLERIARELGMNPGVAMAAVRSRRYQRQLDEDMDLAVALDARGTPTSFVNGRKLRGAQSVARFSKLIDEELAHAARLRRQGVAASRLYAHIIKNGKTAPPPRRTVLPRAGANSPSKGPANAAVTVTIFSDFQCPFCRRVLPTLKQIEQHFPKQVRFVFRHKPLPFHRNAMMAHRAAAEAFAQGGNTAFWRMHNFLFENNTHLTAELIVEGARRQGLNATQVAIAIGDSTHDSAIMRDVKVSEDAGIHGTPGFVVNGEVVSGAQPFAVFRRAIDRALRARGR